MTRALRESDIEEYLVARVKAMGGEVRKVQWIGRRGAPDRLVMLPRSNSAIWNNWSNTIWVELKAPGKTPTAAQSREHERMREMGQRVLVIDSLQGVEEMLG